MKTLNCRLWAVLIIYLLSTAYTKKTEDYGYLLFQDTQAALWWAEGAYKVMKDDPLPKTKKAEVYLECARNEYEPFLLVLKPNRRMDGIRIEARPLVGPNGREIPSSSIAICHVGYVNVLVPTDEYGSAGKWPDPLPPYEGSFSACSGENHSLWITVHVPPETKPGEYRGALTLSCGTWKKEIPVVLRVWGFALPEETHIRSSFGLYTGDIQRYHNLETEEELKKVYDLYLENMREHRLAPTSALDLYPMKERVKGLSWKGGEFVSDVVHSGKRALKVEDNSTSDNIEAVYEDRVPVEPNVPYKLSWYAKTASQKQQYTVLIQCYNAENEFLPPFNQLRVYEGSPEWKQEILEVKGFPPEVKKVSLHFFPTFRDDTGSPTGTTYFDDAVFGPASGGQNLLRAGDFEMDINSLSVEVDFSEFDQGARRYLDEFRFNAFNLSLKGLGTGSYYSQTKGLFAGFRQGTPEYDKLLSQYLGLVEKHLEKKGWLGKEYIYWFDEPDPKDYPFVREGMINIRKAAPRLTRFITEHKPGPDIMDVSEMSCTIFHQVEPKIVAELSQQGREFWSYLCTGPKAPWVTLFIDHPAVNLRIWLWMSYKYKLKGILVWRANYWNSPTVFPSNLVENPWEDPMAYTVGYGIPYGQVNYWGNGDGRFLYPPNKNPNKDKTKYLSGPVNSVRWEILREGIEDYEYLWLLEQAVKNAPPEKRELAEQGRKLLDLPGDIFKSGQEYTKDPKILLDYRKKIAELLEKLFGPV
jgi:hypothetical protein